MPDVVLVQMPFSAIEHPSIALGLLSAVLRRDGLTCRALYPNLDFCSRIGVERYHIIGATLTEELIGEWCFSAAAFPDFRPDNQAWLERVNIRAPQVATWPPEQVHAMLYEVRAAATAFIDETARRIVAMRPRIVGCSSTFQQHCASLALLRRLRELDPTIVTMLGGANCEAEMGVANARAFAWVDFVVSGEAEDLLTPLCRLALEHGRQVPSDLLPYGVLTSDPTTHERRGSRNGEGAPRAAVAKLDDVPTPDYDDWFEALAASPLSRNIVPGVLVETSRGCWWGQKHHCTFCGLNGLGLGYRTKSPDRVIDEMTTLASRYRVPRFEVVDNILDNGHMATVMPRLADLRRQGADWTLFYETKSNLKRDHVRLLTEAGVLWIQPGIESMHDEVLALMDKGSSTMMNVQLLKWAREHGMRVVWNFLLGFPNERDDWYLEMAAWLPLIEHLQPPSGAVPIRYDRFSPYHSRPEQYGIQIITGSNYQYVYPLPPAQLAELAYFFEDAPGQEGREDRRIDTPGRLAVRRLVVDWQKTFWGSKVPPLLSVGDDGTTLRVFDTRRVALERRSRFEGVARLAYLACESAQTLTSVVAQVRRSRPETAEDEVRAALDELERHRLLLCWRGKYLGLGVFGRIPSLPTQTDFPGGFPHAAEAVAARMSPQPLWPPPILALNAPEGSRR